MKTILILGQYPETRAFFREVLLGRGYRVLEAANRQHADAMIGQFETAIDLIFGCSHSDLEASTIRNWHRYHVAMPLLVISATDRPESELFAEEVVLRVQLALEAARPLKSVMVVGEDEAERRMLADLLEIAGYRVTQAGNGKEALALIANDPPDLLLTDIFMPEKDGLELIQEMRRHYFETTIIAMCGDTKATSCLPIARLLGAKVTLRKPFDVNQLLRALRDV